MPISKEWKQLAQEKKQLVDSKIPTEWKLPADLLADYNESTKRCVLEIPQLFLSKSEFHVTEDFTVSQLLDNLKSSKLSAVEVVTSFSHRAAIATQLTNCCTELLFDYGLERARFLDDYLAKNKIPFGPLHGLPISLKDSFFVPGYDSTLGFVSMIGNTATNESDLVKLLSDLGAVFYVKTNVPQTLMTADSENNIFGRTLNPTNLAATAGGSSGGEGALIKMRGSLIGIGTDVAGSIRIPALCNGVYGFRPTTGRIPIGNQQAMSREVYINVICVAGPLSYDFESIQLLTKAIIDHKPWNYDFSCLRLQYQTPTVSNNDKLKIGLIVEDKSLPVHPTIKRIINDAANKMVDAGHSVELIGKFPSYDESWSLAWQLFQTDPHGESWLRLKQSGERIIDSLLLPGLNVYGEPPDSIDTIIKLKQRIMEISEQWFTIFKDFDVILAPGAPSTAPPHDHYGIAPYTTAWNLVDFPACIIPFGKADAKVDFLDDAVYPEKLKGIYAAYTDPEFYDGGIGHVQVIAPHLEDEKLLACCQIIDKVLNSK